jgi:hypothetical protein
MGVTAMSPQMITSALRFAVVKVRKIGYRAGLTELKDKHDLSHFMSQPGNSSPGQGQQHSSERAPNPKILPILLLYRSRQLTAWGVTHVDIAQYLAIVAFIAANSQHRR